MGVASSNRGSRVVRRDVDEMTRVATARAERQAAKDEVQRLRDHITRIERDLKRARRCIAELRRSKDERMAEARAEQSRSDYAIRLLTRLAFPADRTPNPDKDR